MNLSILRKMKTIKPLSYLLFFLLGISQALAQITYTVQPDSNSGKDALVESRLPNTVAGTTYIYNASAWTVQGVPTTFRSLVEFDISSIPSYAMITSATLTLYADSDQWFYHSTLSGSNNGWIQRITSAWSEHQVCWNNQPTVSSNNQVSLPASTGYRQNYTVDVKQLLLDARSANQQALGLMLRLQTEQYYRELNFGSSDHSNPNKRPRFTVTYELPALSLNQPAGAEVWFQGTTHSISWSNTSPLNVDLEYSTDGMNWTTIASGLPSSVSSYSWTTPNIHSNTVKVRVRYSAYPQYKDVSPDFSIVPAPSIALSSPNGGEVWLNNSTRNITWTASNSNNVRIEYTLDAVHWYNVVASTPAGSGTYAWSLPAVNSTQVRVRISDIDYPAFSDMSDQDFSILPPKSIQVHSPNGGENWNQGSLRNIHWTSTRIDSVKIEYSLNNGSNWTTIASAVASAGSNTFQWWVPYVSSQQCKIKISDISGSSTADESDAVFTISPNVGMADAIEGRAAFSVYPNPSRGHVHISFSNDTEHRVEVWNVKGAKLMEYSEEGKEFTLNLEHLGKGLYFLHSEGMVTKLLLQ